jgi:nucleotide-binding universal stress UspA family protein
LAEAELKLEDSRLSYSSQWESEPGMKRFRNILAVYGDKVGADDVFCHAVALANANSARLTLIDALAERYATEAEIAERRKRLKRLVPAIKAEGVGDVSVDVFVGQPFLQIIRQVIRAGHDLVIASADGGATLRNVYFGSTATHLMRKCPCPVWIVKPHQSLSRSTILACIDPAPDSAPDRGAGPNSVERADNELDRKILDLATSLAVANDAELHIAHAWDVEGKDRDTMASETPDATRKAILTKHESEHRERVGALLANYSLARMRHQVHFPRGVPQKAIVELVDEHDVDLVVMGTVSRTGISGLLIGNAAESILSSVECGVFTVKPRGFQTPIMPLKETETA